MYEDAFVRELHKAVIESVDGFNEDSEVIEESGISCTASGRGVEVI